jgi:hypothetical protein
LVTVLPAAVQASVKVVPFVKGGVVKLPDADCVPDQPPEAVQELALTEVQFKMVLPL